MSLPEEVDGLGQQGFSIARQASGSQNGFVSYVIPTSDHSRLADNEGTNSVGRGNSGGWTEG